MTAILAGAVSEMALWTPADITTALWLDAADSSTLFDAVSGGSTPAADGAVARWEDKSGNARHATQSSSGSRPQRKTSLFNSLDSIRFDGSDDILLMDFGGSTSQPVYVFAATRKNGNPADVNGRVFHSSSSNSGESNVFLPLAALGASSGPIAGNYVWNFGSNVNSSAAFGSTHAIYATLASGSGSVIFRNGTSSTTANPGTNALQRYCSIGGRHHDGLRNYNGDISEIIIVSAATATEDRQIIEGYLAHKWGLAGSLPSDHPYKNIPPGFVPIRRRRSRSGGGVL
jgi:hypothetical protein